VTQRSFVKSKKVAHHLKAFFARISVLATVHKVLHSLGHTAVELVVGNAVHKVLGREFVAPVFDLAELRLDKRNRQKLLKIE
jgi:hypothetical protein